MPYIHRIGLENFRLFKDQTIFDLAPITILTGINNSGKSSLIKSLQLFKSSLKKTAGLEELNFSEGRHNLGWYQQVVNSDNQYDPLRFTFDFPISGLKEYLYLELTYRGKEGALKETGELLSFSLLTKNDEFLVKIVTDPSNPLEAKFFADFDKLQSIFNNIFDANFFAEKRILDDLHSNEEKYHEYFSSTNIPDIIETLSIFSTFRQINSYTFNFPFEIDNNKYLIANFDDLDKEDKEEYSQKVSKFKVEGMPFHFVSLESFFKYDIKIIESNLSKIFRYGEVKFPLSSVGKFVIYEFLGKHVPDQLNKLKESLKNINSLSSVRANSERLYSNNSDIVDINGLLIEFAQVSNSINKKTEDFISKSLKLFNIGDKIIVQRHQGLASEIFIKSGDNTKLLADMGFGFTQLVPIIIKIALIANRKYENDFSEYPPSILLLEEPESNLHPSYQSKLAELIIDAAETFNIQFIIETHSEYMIRNFQYLTATKKLKSKDTKIYYFNQPGTKEFEKSPYKIIGIMQDGRLSDEFGKGFFDEIPRLLTYMFNANFN